MTELPPFSAMTSEEKDALIIELWQKIQELEAKILELQNPVKKTSKNSSTPPSQDQKTNISQKSKSNKPATPHQKGGRKLSIDPTELIIAHAQTCPHCQEAVSQVDQYLVGQYDKIDLPSIEPIVTQVKRYGGVCPHCEQYYEAPVSRELEPGSPFGPNICALIFYLRYTSAISYGRLRRLMSDVFSLTLSEGALANMFKRSLKSLEPRMEEILEKLHQSERVNSDETSARVLGLNQWEWVFQNNEVCYHIIRPSRGAQVIEEVMAEVVPEVWGSDLYSAQTCHPGKQWQVCLAHQLRDCQFAMDKGDTIFAPVMQQLFQHAIGIHNRRERLASSTMNRYRSQIKQRLKKALTLNPDQDDGKRLLKRYLKIQKNLFLFLDNPEIPPTNNSSEQALRMSVIFRKVTNGFRSDWGKEVFASIRSIINTGKRQGFSAFQAIQRALDSEIISFLPS